MQIIFNKINYGKFFVSFSVIYIQNQLLITGDSRYNLFEL